MNYDERMMQIKKELAEMLSEYAAPKHLIDPASQAKDIQSTAEVINALFPNDTNQDHITGTLKRAAMKLKGAHKSRTWPLASDITTAVKKSMNVQGSPMPVNKGPWKPDTLAINARRIKAGEPVGEMYIRGKLADKMVEMGLISEAHLQPYLEYLSVHNIPARVDPPIS